MEHYIYCGKDKCGNYIISGDGHRMTYIGYTKKEARAKFRQQFGLVRKRITWIGD